jgi:antitoxin component of MazEF toxin-antitoxin module
VQLIAKFVKWGRSLALPIPKSLAKAIGVHDGSAADLTIEAGRLVVGQAGESDNDLDVLLSQITPANLHCKTQRVPRATTSFKWPTAYRSFH